MGLGTPYRVPPPRFQTISFTAMPPLGKGWGWAQGRAQHNAPLTPNAEWAQTQCAPSKKRKEKITQCGGAELSGGHIAAPPPTPLSPVPSPLSPPFYLGITAPDWGGGGLGLWVFFSPPGSWLCFPYRCTNKSLFIATADDGGRGGGRGVPHSLGAAVGPRAAGGWRIWGQVPTFAFSFPSLSPL